MDFRPHNALLVDNFLRCWLIGLNFSPGKYVLALAPISANVDVNKKKKKNPDLNDLPLLAIVIIFRFRMEAAPAADYIQWTESPVNHVKAGHSLTLPIGRCPVVG